MNAMLRRIKPSPSSETSVNVDCIGILGTGYDRLVSRSETKKEKKKNPYNCNVCARQGEKGSDGQEPLKTGRESVDIKM
jgi:hypothetical protein